MSRGDKIKNGLKNIGWLVAFPVPVTKALATKKGGKLGRKAATIAATWAMYLGLATAGVSAQINRPAPKPVDTVAEVVDDETQPVENPTEEEPVNEPVNEPVEDSGERIEPRLVEFHDYVTYNYNRLLGVGEQTHYMAHVLPLTAYDTSITWSSSNESVAIVDEYGMVTAVGEGRATIIACSVNGIESYAYVTVKQPATMRLSITVTADGEEIDPDSYEWYINWSVKGFDDSFVEERAQLSDESEGNTIQVVPGRRLEFFYYLYDRDMLTRDSGSNQREITQQIITDGCDVSLKLHLEKDSYRTYDVEPKQKDVVVTFTLTPVK